MAILDKGNTYSSGQSVTATNLNALVDSATFKTGNGEAVDGSTLQVHASGYLMVKDGGISATKLAAGAAASAIGTGGISDTELATNSVTTIKIKDSTGASDGVTTAKLATGAVATAKIADNAITPAKISSNDTLLNVNDTHQTIGLGILANSASSSPKVNMDGGVRIGNVAPSVAGELEVTGSGAANILVVENTSTTASDQSIISVRGPQSTIQIKDTVAPANQGIFNITVDGGYLQISLINDNGTSGGGLLRLRPNGNLSILGTLAQGGLT
tara:strand:+ start:252 stop:1067 length:816 start_codon:yes stop_codon:yes gene_type:complete